MAILKGGFLSGISGKIDKVVARRVNGKTVISNRPSTYNKTKSKKAKSVRNRFAIAVEFSRYINSIELLKNIWKYNFPKCSSAFNMIESYNIKKVGDRTPSLINIITPPPGKIKNYLPHIINEINFDGKKITVILKNNDQLKLPSADCEYFLVFVLLYYEPKRKGEKYFTFVNIISRLSTNSNNIDIVLKKLGNVYSSYKKLIIY